MTTLTEGRRAAEFVLSEANGNRSRENGTVVTGQDLVAGQLVQDNGAGKLTAYTGTLNTAGALIAEAVGILLYDVDASLADVDASYIARDAEVNGNILTFPDETTDGDERANAVASLATLGIIVRD